ncbi:MAG: DUF1294 domain-containing protein [Clostridia bacterium]
MLKILIVFLIIINWTGFISMGYDKHQAIHHKWRVSENTLLTIAFLGGGLGSLCGMYCYHHKTKKIKFTFLVPILAALDSFALIYLLMQVF